VQKRGQGITASGFNKNLKGRERGKKYNEKIEGCLLKIPQSFFVNKSCVSNYFYSNILLEIRQKNCDEHRD
jgi:hypothetical protein